MKARLGQHFLVHRRFVERIVSACGLDPGQLVLEIGAGRGALTHALADTGAKVVAVELDGRLVGPLRAMAKPNVEVVHGDILELDLERTIHSRGYENVTIVGNLPYQISSPVLFWLLAKPHLWKRAVLMLQREVAARLTAEPGSREYGVLAARVGAEAKAERMFDLPPEAFRPRPGVVSRVMRLTPLGEPRIRGSREIYARVVRAAFGQRRKMLGNALGELLSQGALAQIGIDPRRRGETLSIEEFDKIACHLARAT